MSAFTAFLMSFIFCLSASAHAVENGRLDTITVKQAKPLFGSRLKPVRVRIGVDYQKYDSVLVKNEVGKARYKSIPSQRQIHTLRSRLEQKNHFYFNGLHVETNPVKWDRDSMKYSVRLDFYRTFGMHGELEEKLGSVLADGVLKGQGRLFNFIGEKMVEFKNQRGVQIATIRVGTPTIEKKPMLSKYNGVIKK